MSHEIILHVGTHKTGTTSFQQALVDHQRPLIRAGVRVATEPTPPGGLRANSTLFSDAVLRPSLVTGFRGRYGRTSAWRDRVAQAGALRLPTNAKVTRSLVSAEALCFARTPAERRRMRMALRLAEATSVKVLLVVRQRDAWRRSWERQTATMHASLDPQDRGTGTDLITGDWYYDVDAIRAFWRRIGTVQELNYEDEVDRHGSTIPGLLEAMGVDPGLVEQDYFLNEGARKEAP